MTIEKQLAEKLVDYYAQKVVTQHMSYQPELNRFHQNMEYLLRQVSFSTSWSMGGTSGGYDGSMHTREPDIEPELEDLDEFLIIHYPNMGILQYKMIMKAVKKDTQYESDYYGGTAIEGIKSLKFEDLSDVLVKYGFENSGEYVDNLMDVVHEKYNQAWFDKAYPPSLNKAQKKELKKIAKQFK